MIYFCCNELRRNAVRGRDDINGIDFLEVIDRNAVSDDQRQRQLHVHLVNAHSGDAFTPDNVRIEGGERVKNIEVTGVITGEGGTANVVTVEVDRYGDFSTYTFRLLRSSINKDTRPPQGFDPMLAAIEFSFKVECPSEFDCAPNRNCPPDVKTKPQIDYLAKDYASFRRLMLDRMAALVPEWQERHAADFGVALVELLAYTADHLSYEQDAVATEAYLNTCRRRVSARRHARLVDYFINEGSNARTWVQIEVNADVLRQVPGKPIMPKGTQLFTVIPGQSVLLPNDDQVLSKAKLVFETMHDLDELYVGHNKISFYTWSDTQCCLPAGATRATLKGHLPNLQARDQVRDIVGDEEKVIKGDVLVFEENIGPKTGSPADADLNHRHAVLLTRVRAFDENGNPLKDLVTEEFITEIEWAPEDALPFAFCISSENKRDVSVARGNIVLADHGRTVTEQDWAPVPDPTLKYVPESATDRCKAPEPEAIPIRFNPHLQEGPVTHAPELQRLASARAAMQWTQRQVLPAIDLKVIEGNVEKELWESKRDLLNSDEDDLHFVVEIESDGIAMLRFGDDQRGKQPNAGTRFAAIYRVGNGTAGNIGVDSLLHILSDERAITGVRNLTPGQGGTDPESIEDVRQRAPYAFRTQERAVTQKDYEAVTRRYPDIQRVAAMQRWTGSWHTWFLTVDRKGGLDVNADFEKEVRNYVERFRLAGYDLEVDEPIFVPLRVEMFVCVKPDFFRSDVKAALLAVFNNQRLPDGRLGVFHPDNFTFRQTLYLSPLYAWAQAVPGVASVQITAFQRQDVSDSESLEAGKLTMDRREIARLDNDPNFPEHGVFHLQMGGGK